MGEALDQQGLKKKDGSSIEITFRTENDQGKNAFAWPMS
jgi:hypothetical protein